MSKITLANLLSGFLSNNKLNSNFTKITTAFENTLSRDGTSPNAMGAPLDMGTHPILNVGTPTGPNDAVRLKDIQDITDGATITINTNWTDIVGKPTNFPTVSTSVSDFAAASRAVTQAQLVAGSNVTITPVGSTLVVASAGSGGTSAVVSITDYGAVCDGTTDDTTAWNDAIADVNSGTIASIYVPGFSCVAGTLTTITNKLTIQGAGMGSSGIIQMSGGDVLMLHVDYTGGATNVIRSQLRFCAQDLYIGGGQVLLGQAMKIHVYEESAVVFNNLYVSGYPSRFGTPKHGWKRGIELVNVTSSTFNNVTVQGCVNAALTWPNNVLATDYAWNVYSEAAHSTTNNRWISCDVLYVDKAWKCEAGNIQGLFWTDCTPAWVGTGWSINMTIGSWGPCFGWNGGSPECFHMGISATNIAYLDIANLTFLMDMEFVEVRKAVLLTNCYQARVHDNMLVNIGSIVGPNLGTCSFLATTDCQHVLSSGNQISGLDAYGIHFAGSTSYSETINDRIYSVTGTGTPFSNDGSAPLTNKRRGMIIDGATAAQGKTIDTVVNTTANPTAPTAQTQYLSLPFGVEVGDKIRVTLRCQAQYGAGATQLTAIVREYTHRPGTASPYQVLEYTPGQKNWNGYKTLDTVSGTAGFNQTIDFDVIASASDAAMSFELLSSTNTFIFTDAGFKVERL